MRGRAERRQQELRAKDKARRFMRQVWREEPNPRWVGRLASTHCVPCSCIFCRNPREDRPRERVHWERTRLGTIDGEYEMLMLGNDELVSPWMIDCDLHPDWYD